MNKQKLLVVLVLLPVVCSLFFSAGFVSAYDLELDDYAHYKVIAYEAGVGAGVDYQVVIVVHYGTGTDGTMTLNGETVALLHVGDIQADFDDVRFANQFGELLTFKRCSYTSAVNATFVVKVEANLDVDQLVYVYFGNLAAVDASSDSALIDIVGGVVGAWHLNELTATTIEDYSGSNFDGTVVGTSVVASNRVGFNARYFDGIDDTVSMGDVLDMGTSNYTVVVWANCVTPNATRVLLDKRDSSVGTNDGFNLQFESGSNRLKGYFCDGSATRINHYSDNAVFSQWNMFTTKYVRNGSAEMYINKGSVVSVSISAQSGDVSNSVALRVGSTSVPSGYFIGSIGQILIFNTIISSTTMNEIYDYFADASLVAGSVLVRKWATTTLPAVAGVSDAVDNSAFSPVVDGALTDTEWFISGLLLVLALANVVLLAFPFALLRFVFGVLSFALSAWAFTYSGLPLAPYLQVMGLVVSVVCMFLATRARE